MHRNIKRILITLLSAIIITGSLISHAAPGGAGGPKTSQHASFKPADFERVAVIIKPMQSGMQGINMNMGLRAGQARPHHEQTQIERLIEQRFMRVLLHGGYTLVARTDLDSAMKEKGLDEANLTDEKLTQEAGKFLHVSAIMVVSVDDLKTTPMQRVVKLATGGPFGGGPQTTTYYQVAASVSARLVKIDDNMVMWTGDLTLDQAYNSQDVEGSVLGLMSESIANSFPALTPPKEKTK